MVKMFAMRRALVVILISLVALPTYAGVRRRVAGAASNVKPPEPQTIVVTPSKDATLFQDSDGALANGKGVHILAGTTGAGGVRRAVVAFDLSQIPTGSHITRVVLTMSMSKSLSTSTPMDLHALSTNWSEGPSNAGSTRDGTGTASKTGDVTWIHTTLPGARWNKEGGDFAAAIDGTATVATVGTVTWPTSDAMVARVQSWVDQPSTNFGWILIANEAQVTTAKHFDSRETSRAPQLTIEFTK